VQVSVARTESCQAHVTFTVPHDEFDAEFQRALREVGRRVKMKGFRPGHVPTAVVEKFNGAQVRQEVAQKFLNQAYQRAIQENELKPLAHPRIDLGEIEAGKDFAREFDVNLRPTFDLPEYKGLKVESQLAPVMDTDVEAAIEQARKNQAHPEAAGDDGTPEDGMVLAKVELLYQGNVVFERDGLRLAPGTSVPGVEPSAYKNALIGTKDGAVVELPVDFPADFEHEAARNQTGTCRISVKQAFKVLVPTREELMKILGVEDEAGLKKLAQDKLEEAQLNAENNRIEAALLDRVIAATPMELPLMMVEEQAQARLAQMRQELAGQGVPEAKIAEEISAREAEARTGADKSARGYFLIEQIADKEGLKVVEADLMGELRSIAKRNKASLEEVREYYKEQNLVPQLAMEILERKVRAFLRANAVVEPSPEV
jgi:trigger factor